MASVRSGGWGNPHHVHWQIQGTVLTDLAHCACLEGGRVASLPTAVTFPIPLTLPSFHRETGTKPCAFTLCIWKDSLTFSVASLCSSANATPEFEGRGGDDLGTEIANTLYRIFNNKSSIDLKSLCISPREHCWILYVDVLVRITLLYWPHCLPLLEASWPTFLLVLFSSSSGWSSFNFQLPGED